MKVEFRKEVVVSEARCYRLTEREIEALGVSVEFFEGLSPEEQESLLGDLSAYPYEVEETHDI